MNGKRRTRLGKILETIEIVINELEDIHDEEEMAMDNMPEGLWNSERYSDMENACANLQDAISVMNDVFDYITGTMVQMKKGAKRI
ncbi:MAG: hypothetical protein LIO94_06925 [Clostridiales bacterium]|nr:hypothetical protein [Clostridiales bacterium]